MKLAYLAEVAALLSAHAGQIIHRDEVISTESLGDYYIHSRNRFNRWMQDLTDLELGRTPRVSSRIASIFSPRPESVSLAEQILLSDLMCRVWTTTLMACDRNHNLERCAPIARNVHMGQMVARKKVLTLCLADDMIEDEILALDELRRRCERWSDLLCSHIMFEFDLWEMAYNEETARDFAHENCDRDVFSRTSRVWSLILAGLRAAFPPTGHLSVPAHPDDRLIIRTIMEEFPQDETELTFWAEQTVKSARSL